MVTSNIGAIGTASVLLEEARRILGRIRTATLQLHIHRRDVLDTLEQYAAQLNELKIALEVLQAAGNDNSRHLGPALGQLQVVQERLLGFLKELDPQAGDFENRLRRKWDREVLRFIMIELAGAKFEVQRRSALFPESSTSGSSDDIAKPASNVTISSSSRGKTGTTNPESSILPELGGSTRGLPISRKTTPLFPVTFNGNTLSQKETSDSPSKYIVIQTRTPLGSKENHLAAKELSDIGLTLLLQISRNTYLFHRQELGLHEIRQLPYIVFAGVFDRDLKISSSLQAERGYNMSNVLCTVDVVFHEDVDTDSEELREAIARKACLGSSCLEFSQHKVRLETKEKYIEHLASIDQVQWIERVLTVGLKSGFARQILKAGVALPQHNIVYEGKGQVIAVADTGFDRGNIRHTHPAFTTSQSGRQFRNRVLTLYPMSEMTSLSDFDGHGTHVCALAVGNGVSKNSNRSETVMKGTAPQASLVVQCLGHDLNGIPRDLTDLFRLPYYNNRARIHTNSWGAKWTGQQQIYTTSSREIDAFVWNHPDMVICFAAGNDGDCNRHDLGRQIGAEAAAKNCITIGATKNVLLKPNEMLSDSSRGPTREGRRKPDVVAPGGTILSANSGHRAYPHRGGIPSHSDANWAYLSGTSMAAPLVAGCAAVLREALIAHGTANPSAALIKALLINGSVALGDPPQINYKSGFGRVDLANSTAIACGVGSTGFQEGALNLRDLPEETVTIQVSVPGRLKVTLTWTDYPGLELQNKLYLVVQASNRETRHTHGSDDNFVVDNSQQLEWYQIPAGVATITIQAYEIIQPARNPHQSYACVWQLL